MREITEMLKSEESFLYLTVLGGMIFKLIKVLLHCHFYYKNYIYYRNDTYVCMYCGNVRKCKQ